MKNVPLKLTKTDGTYNKTHFRNYSNPTFASKLSIVDALNYGIKASKRANSKSLEKTTLVNKIDCGSPSPVKPKYQQKYRMESPIKSSSAQKNTRSPSSKFGGIDECTKINYKSGETKMEKFINRKEDNLQLYYKNGQLLFRGDVLLAGSTIEEGTWYYENGQVYYKGTFNKQGHPEGENCTLYNEDGSVKFLGEIDKCLIDIKIPSKRKKDPMESEDIPVPAKKLEIKKMKIKIDPGKISIIQLTRQEYIDIPRDGIMFAWKRENMTESRFMDEVFQDYEEFVYCGSVKNGYIEGKGKLFYQEADAKPELDELIEAEEKSKKSNKSSIKYSSSNRNIKGSPGGNTLDVPTKSNMYGSSSNIKKNLESTPSKCISPEPNSFMKAERKNSGNKTPTNEIKLIKVTQTPEKNRDVNNKMNTTPKAKMNRVDLLNNTAPNLKKLQETEEKQNVNISQFNVNDDNLSMSKTPCSGVAVKMTDVSSEDKYKRQLFYEGEFLRGLIHNRVKFYKITTEEEPEAIFTGSMEEGLLTGHGKYFYPSGKRFLQGHWDNDVMIGTGNTGFYETGYKFFEGMWGVEGLGHDIKIYDRNGKSVSYKGTTYPLNYNSYKLDWLKGTSFDRMTGKPRCIGAWVNGKLTGDGVEIYDNTGVLMSIGNYHEGSQISSKEWNKEGKLKLECNWKNNRMQGQVKRYGSKEEPLYDGLYGNGLKDGFGIEYWDLESTNGKPKVKKIEGTYKRGKLYGECIRIYNKDEIQQYEGGMKNDLKDGPGKLYHKNGLLEMSCMWAQDKQNDSRVRVFSNEGFPIYEGEYRKGFRQGLGRMWDYRGKLKFVGQFDGTHNYNRKKSGWHIDHVGKFVAFMGVEMK